MINGMLDLFAGTGVGVAAHQLGITEYGVENMPAAVATRNVAGFLTPYNDVWDIDEAEGLNFNTLWASPPCQTFSVAGKGKGHKALDDVVQAIHNAKYLSMGSLRTLGSEVGDERTALVLTPLTYIHRYRPRFVALEQVPTVLPVWNAYVGPLEEMGYSVWVGYLHAEQYGVPQTRKRAYLIARLDGEAKPPRPTHSKYYSHNPTKLDEGVEKWVSMYDALGMARPLISNYSAGAGGIAVEGNVKNRGFRGADAPASTVTSKFMRWGDPVLIHGKQNNAAERPLTHPAATMAFGHDFNSFRFAGDGESRNLTLDEAAILQGYPKAWSITDQPSPTITSHLGVTRSPSGTQRVYLDAIERGAFEFKPVEPKLSTVAVDGIGAKFAPNTVNTETSEGGVLQGFPHGFPFQGSKTNQHLQVGNAVPPPVAKAVLQTFMEDAE